MHNLAQLKSGELSGIKRLQISENLTEFPNEIFTLADSLEILDLSNNQLSELPNNLPELTNLKVLFCSNNQFNELPKVLAACPKLEMIGFKSNRIKHFAENSLPLKTRWLILTDNQLTALPRSIGDLTQLKKLMLAGNQLQNLPKEIQHCHNLELVRLSANQLTSLPNELLNLPKLSWLAFSGNAFCASIAKSTTINAVNKQDIEFHEPLGEGASGVIHRAKWSTSYAQPKKAQGQIVEKNIAVKLFKGQVTSDGYPTDELNACLHIGQHPNLVETLAILDEPEQTGMVMRLIPKKFYNLGLPPSLQSCTRDCFDDKLSLSVTSILKILIQVADSVAHIHQQGFCHGDLYAHNILINPNHAVLLGDFGAASCLNPLSKSQQQKLVQIEIRAFSHLIEDLLNVAQASAMGSYLSNTLKDLVTYCREEQDLTFSEIKTELISLNELSL